MVIMLRKYLGELEEAGYVERASNPDITQRAFDYLTRAGFPEIVNWESEVKILSTAEVLSPSLKNYIISNSICVLLGLGPSGVNVMSHESTSGLPIIRSTSSLRFSATSKTAPPRNSTPWKVTLTLHYPVIFSLHSLSAVLS